MRYTLTLAVAAAALATALPAFAEAPAKTAPAAAESSTAAQQPASTEESQSAQSAGAPASTTAAAATPTLSIGQPVKDKTGAVIGSISDLKSGADGQTATVKMGAQTFAVDAKSFVVQDGAAVVNATQAELKQMIASAAKPG